MSDTPVRNTLNGRVHRYRGDLSDGEPIITLCGATLLRFLTERVEGAYPTRAACKLCAELTS